MCYISAGLGVMNRLTQLNIASGDGLSVTEELKLDDFR